MPGMKRTKQQPCDGLEAAKARHAIIADAAKAVATATKKSEPVPPPDKKGPEDPNAA